MKRNLCFILLLMVVLPLSACSPAILPPIGYEYQFHSPPSLVTDYAVVSAKEVAGLLPLPEENYPDWYQPRGYAIVASLRGTLGGVFLLNCTVAEVTVVKAVDVVTRSYAQDTPSDVNINFFTLAQCRVKQVLCQGSMADAGLEKGDVIRVALKGPAGITLADRQPVQRGSSYVMALASPYFPTPAEVIGPLLRILDDPDEPSQSYYDFFSRCFQLPVHKQGVEVSLLLKATRQKVPDTAVYWSMEEISEYIQKQMTRIEEGLNPKHSDQ